MASAGSGRLAQEALLAAVAVRREAVGLQRLLDGVIEHADAQHLAAEYVVRFQSNRPALRAIALTTDSSLLTACAWNVPALFVTRLLTGAGLSAMTVVAILGGSLTNVMIAVGISSIPGFARLVRGSVLSAKENEYVLAARVTGCRGGRIMVVHILPNVFAPLLTYATLRISTSIIAAASLNFLGLGAERPTPEWGVMLSDGRDYMREYWWLSTFPGLAIMVTALSINMLGDGLRDALDPRLRRGL